MMVKKLQNWLILNRLTCTKDSYDIDSLSNVVWVISLFLEISVVDVILDVGNTVVGVTLVAELIAVVSLMLVIDHTGY